MWGLTVGEPEKDTETPGVPIAAVLAGSPAEKGGLKPGDRIITLDGRWTVSAADAHAAAVGAAPGKPAKVEILRGGKEMTLEVTPSDGI